MTDTLADRCEQRAGTLTQLARENRALDTADSQSHLTLTRTLLEECAAALRVRGEAYAYWFEFSVPDSNFNHASFSMTDPRTNCPIPAAKVLQVIPLYKQEPEQADRIEQLEALLETARDKLKAVQGAYATGSYSSGLIAEIDSALKETDA